MRRPALALALLLTLAVRPDARPAPRSCPPADCPADSLWAGFVAPPDSCRTKVWWFHGETETTRAGITADLEALRAAGIGGVVYYDQVHGRGEGALPAFSPGWWQMLTFAASEAHRLGLTFETHLSNGYCAGGPWITPGLAMQMLVASDTARSDGRLVAVMAWPTPRAGRARRPVATPPTLSPEAGPVDLVADMGVPFTARGISYTTNGRGKTRTRSMNVPCPPQEEFTGAKFDPLPPLGELLVSDDSATWRTVCTLRPIYAGATRWRATHVAFAPTTGRYYRLHLHDWALPGEGPLRLSGVELHAAALADRWEVKAGLVSDFIDPDATPDYAPADVVDPDSIVDLTPLAAPGGPGLPPLDTARWTVVRFYQVPTLARTRHGRPGLMGLECDKLSAEAARVQFERYYGVMSDSLEAHGLSIDGLCVDSHEAGAQNWTADFEQAFASLRHYDLRRYLPVMAGYVVGSRARTDTVLADVRRTVADLVSTRYFATIDSLCRQRGIPFTAQAVGNALCIVGDPLQAKGRVAIPQGEFWAYQADGNFDIKEASSAAHLYHKARASGEAFTDAHFDTPLSYLKTLADNAFCYGLNELVVCASAYQPWLDRWPGSTGGGRHYCLNRNSTYWPYSRPFWDYQARCAYLLRQGRPVVDYCLYLGDDVPIKIRAHQLPVMPSGTDFDAATTDALVRRMAVSGGRICLPDGMSYAAMIVPPQARLTPAIRARLDSMQRAGMTLITGAPLRPDPDVALMHADLRALGVWWAHRTLPGADLYFVSNHGDRPVDDTLSLRCRRGRAEWWDPATGLRRHLPIVTPGPADTLMGGRPAAGRTAVRLTLGPKEAGFVVLIDPDMPDGPQPRADDGGRLQGHGHKGAARRAHRLASTPRRGRRPSGPQVVEVGGPWDIGFAPEGGGPGLTHADSLYDWSQSPDSAIAYYSGTATYTTTVRLGARVAGRRRSKLARRSPRADGRTLVRLDGLHDIARLWVNGHDAGVVWCAPFTADVTPYVRRGANRLRIDVANAWTNRMTGDAATPTAPGQVTYAYPAVQHPGDPLVPSGLTGPVRIERWPADE